MKLSVFIVFLLLFIPLVNSYYQTDNNEESGDQTLGAVDGSNLSYKGYIIKFKEKPLIEQNRLGLKPSVGLGRVDKIAVNFKSKAVTILNKKNINELKVLGEFKNTFMGIALDITDMEAEKLRHLDEVDSVHRNYEVRALLMDTVPLINADDVWLLDANGNDCLITGNTCLTGSGITIAIIDTGVDYTHPDLGGCFGPGCKVEAGYDFHNGDSDPIDDHFHGTHVAGIAAGNGVLKGIAPDAKIHAYKVLSYTGTGFESNVIAAIEKSIDPNNDGDFSDRADIISMSLGKDCGGDYQADCGPEDPLSTASNNAVYAGSIVVIAAGNSGYGTYGTIVCPGCAEKVITVGASYNNDYTGNYFGDNNPIRDQIARFSSLGPVRWDGNEILKPDIVAPGALICSARYDSVLGTGLYTTCFDSLHVLLAGTSMATPVVSGAAALLKQKNPALDNDKIKKILSETAIDTATITGIPANIYQQGRGRIDILAAINAPEFPESIITTIGIAGGGSLAVRGSAYGNNFQGYRLYYGPFDNIDTWNLLHESASQVIDNVLYTWDISSLQDGLYTLKLEVDGSATSTAYSVIEIRNTYIKSPKDLIKLKRHKKEIIPAWQGNLEITGSSYTQDFNHYEISYCYRNNLYERLNFAPCSKNHVTLTNNGMTPVIDNVLGQINLEELPGSKFYTIILRTYLNDGTYIGNNITTYVEQNLIPGWPIKIDYRPYEIAYYFTKIEDDPKLFDINLDGKKDVIISGYKLGVLDYTGNHLPGWPADIIQDTCYQYPTMIPYGPAIGNLDNDEYPELAAVDFCGNLYAFNHDGTNLFQPIPLAVNSDIPTNEIGKLGAPVIADINGDGIQEIIVGGYENLYVLNSNGINLAGWPFQLPGGNIFDKNESYNFRYAAVADIDGDSQNEIIANTIASFSNQGRQKSYIVALNGDGTIVPGWPRHLGNIGYVYSVFPITIGDIDADGDLEILTANRRRMFLNSVYITKTNVSIYAFNDDGSNFAGWPKVIYDLSGLRESVPSPILGNIDTASDLEILINGNLCVNQFKKDGTLIRSNCPDPALGLLFPGSFLEGLVLADIDGLQGNEILSQQHHSGSPGFSFMGFFYAMNIDGSYVAGFPKVLDDEFFGTDTIPVGDIDGDSRNDFILISYTGNVYAYKTNGDVYSRLSNWPQALHDEKNTGNYHYSLPIFSNIKNDGNSDMAGYLTIKAQKKLDNNWQDQLVLINNEFNIIPPKTSLSLVNIWNSQRPILPEGKYRAYAEFTNANGMPLQTSNGPLVQYQEFSVIPISGVKPPRVTTTTVFDIAPI